MSGYTLLLFLVPAVVVADHQTAFGLGTLRPRPRRPSSVGHQRLLTDLRHCARCGGLASMSYPRLPSQRRLRTGRMADRAAHRTTWRHRRPYQVSPIAAPFQHWHFSDDKPLTGGLTGCLPGWHQVGQSGALYPTANRRGVAMAVIPGASVRYYQLSTVGQERQ
jgi:hypothetical protein